MPLKHKIYFLLASLHLVLIALFASHFGEWGNEKLPVIKAASCIGDYTGSNNIFSFFAPGLSDQPYVVYATKDTTGKEHVLDLKGSSPDFTNRINNIYGYLTLEEGRSVFSASLAQFVLQRYPSADKVRVALVVQKIPTMEEFRNGKRCQWHFWFHRDFEKNNALAAKSKIN
jgi:hypothetical protein